jgi:hypothetical protein
VSWKKIGSYAGKKVTVRMFDRTIDYSGAKPNRSENENVENDLHPNWQNFRVNFLAGNF